MARTVQADIDRPGPPATYRDDGPWWRRDWKLIATALAAAFLGVASTLAVTASGSVRSGSKVDIGFLQDMRIHHEQAINMAEIMIEKPSSGQNLDLRTIADEIMHGQQLEVGMMVQMLRDMGAEEANTTGLSMKWMIHEMPSAAMPGLASDDDIVKLSKLTGVDADRLFATLMIAHHQAGITMAQYAADHADDGSVRALARSMVAGQQGEVVELRGFLAKLGG